VLVVICYWENGVPQKIQNKKSVTIYSEMNSMLLVATFDFRLLFIS